jgi:hypothetical protein
MRAAVMSHGHYALIGKLYPAYLEKNGDFKNGGRFIWQL